LKKFLPTGGEAGEGGGRSLSSWELAGELRLGEGKKKKQVLDETGRVSERKKCGERSGGKHGGEGEKKGAGEKMRVIGEMIWGGERQEREDLTETRGPGKRRPRLKIRNRAKEQGILPGRYLKVTTGM